MYDRNPEASCIAQMLAASRNQFGMSVFVPWATGCSERTFSKWRDQWKASIFKYGCCHLIDLSLASHKQNHEKSLKTFLKRLVMENSIMHFSVQFEESYSEV